MNNFLLSLAVKPNVKQEEELSGEEANTSTSPYKPKKNIAVRIATVVPNSAPIANTTRDGIA